VDGSERLISLALSLLPEWGKYDPHAMGLACVDECVRQLILTGANPDKLAILDNFCMGNPHAPKELGALVEAAKGLAEAALVYGTPFISGKDSFYNFFNTEDGPVSIPVTALISGLGIVEDASHVTGSSIRRTGSWLYLVGGPDSANARGSLGGSVYARAEGLANQPVPQFDPAKALPTYQAYHECVKAGHILSAHDVSEGGLLTALAEMGFSMKAGLDIFLMPVPTQPVVQLFDETPGQFIIEVRKEHMREVTDAFRGLPCTPLGQTVAAHRRLRVFADADKSLVDEDLRELKQIWKSGLAKWY
jgi:phosphoribosylformylglycinamidine synthase subunit PurSL